MVDLQEPLVRSISPALERALAQFPVVVISGARQTGKTTLVRGLSTPAGPRRYVTFDDLRHLDAAEKYPAGLIGEGPVTFDEVQRIPPFLSAVKQAVDERRTPGRVLLAGSADRLQLKRSSERLAGRATYLNLRPMTESEKRGRPEDERWSFMLGSATIEDARSHAIYATPKGAPIDWRRAVLEGGFPEAALNPDPAARSRWFDAYADTFVHRDMRDLARVADLPAFLRLIRQVAMRTGKVLNAADLAADCGLPRSTVARWLERIEMSFLLTMLPAFYESRGKRLIKAPKLYALDTGLALHLSGATDAAAIDALPQRGVWLENLILNDLLAWRDALGSQIEIYFYRTADGREIDFVLEYGRRLLPIEVRAEENPRVDDGRFVAQFCRDYSDRAPFGLVLHTGSVVSTLGPDVLAVPISNLL